MHRTQPVTETGNEVPSLAVMCPYFSEITVFRELGVDGKFQARLKPNVVPSIPLTVSREVKDIFFNENFIFIVQNTYINITAYRKQTCI
jgi:hypothetical protein